MTEPSAIELAALLRKSRLLLLDFDGPICSIFSGHPASLVAQRLASALADDGETVPERLHETADPFDVLRFAFTLSADAARRTETRLREAEVLAVSTATPTPGAARVINAWLSSGHIVAAVSNNSEAAVSAFAENHQLPIAPIIGRTDGDARLLKPNPHLLLRALASTSTSEKEALFVGDSPSDIEAGRRARVATVGYANKPGKRERLAAAGASAIIDNLEELTREISEPSMNEQRTG